MKKENFIPAEGENLISDEDLICMAREGSSLAYDVLISKYRSLAKAIARRYYILGGDNEDVVQEGMIGIFKAIRDYDMEAGASFRSFAALCVERQIQTAVEGANREKHKILNESVPLFDGGEEDDGYSRGREVKPADSLLASKNEEPEKRTLMKEAMKELRELSQENLSKFETEVFDSLIQGKTYQEIALEMGKTPKSVDNAIQRIKKKLGVVGVPDLY